MTHRGHVENEVVVLDEPAELPEGAVVEVDLLAPEDQGESLRELFMRFSGVIKGFPSEFSENHDHYIHGTPKR